MIANMTLIVICQHPVATPPSAPSFSLSSARKRGWKADRIIITGVFVQQKWKHHGRVGLIIAGALTRAEFLAGQQIRSGGLAFDLGLALVAFVRGAVSQKLGSDAFCQPDAKLQLVLSARGTKSSAPRVLRHCRAAVTMATQSTSHECLWGGVEAVLCGRAMHYVLAANWMNRV